MTIRHPAAIASLLTILVGQDPAQLPPHSRPVDSRPAHSRPAESRPATPPAIAELRVRALHAVAVPTRRGSTAFSFRIVAAPLDPAGIVARRSDEIGFRSFQGADRQDGKDAATRVLEFLQARPAAAADATLERGFELPDRGELRLLIARPAPTAEELWVLTDDQGRRVAFAPFRMN